MPGAKKERSVSWLWPMLLPVVPVCLALVLLEWIGAPGPGIVLAENMLASSDVAVLRHSADRLLFASAVAIHTAVCAAAIVYYGMVVLRMGGNERRSITRMIIVVAAGVLGAMVALAFVDPPLTAYRYTYFSVADLMRVSPVGTDLADTGGIAVLAICVLYPSALGVIAVVMASGAVCAALRRIGPAGGERWAERITDDGRVLLHCFYVLSGVLVTSAATALLFFHLPVGLVSTAAEHEPVAKAISTYASGLSTFWGAIYTLTLFAVFAGPVAVLYARAHEVLAGQGEGLSVANWLTQNGFNVSIGQSIKNVFVLIAPLLVGPFGELLKLIGG